jgi:tRNA threonylcarbamoyladenosine biosynthesis protein TsaB
MNILAIDTASSVLSLALGTEEGVWSAAADAGLRHSEMLMDLVDGLAKHAGLSPRDLGGAACMKGPGSFTGLRIGFSTAKGLALALGIPFIAVPTLDCMALPYASWPDLALPVIDAKKQRFFTALYRENVRLTDFLDASVPDIARLIIREREKKAFDRVIITGPDAEMIYTDLVSSCTALTRDPPLFLTGNRRRTGWGIELMDMAKKTIIKDGSDETNSGPEYIRKSDAELAASGKAGPYG